MMMLLITYAVGGILMIMLAIPLIQQRIPPNRWYGYRVRQTLEDPDVWYAVNAYAGVRLFWAGVVISVASSVLYLVPGLSMDMYSLVCLVVSMAALAASLGSSGRYLQTVVKQP